VEVFPDSDAVPSLRRAPNPGKRQQTGRRRWKALRLLFTLAVWLALIGALAPAVVYGLEQWTRNEARLESLRDNLNVFPDYDAIGRKYGPWYFLALLVVPCLLVLTTVPTMGKLRLLQPNPARLLLLRPFGAGSVTRSLRGLMRRYVDGLGFTYTLADDSFRTRRFTRLIWWLLIVGAVLSRFLVFIAVLLMIRFPQYLPTLKIESDKDIDTLKQRLVRRFPQTAAAFHAHGEPVALVCSNALWKRVVALMMQSSDVIIMDVSLVSQGSSWELQRLGSAGLTEKTVFIAEAGHESEARAALRDRGFPSDRLYLYAPDGRILSGQAGFADDIAAALERSVEAVA
jgi:hypothetical protein